VPSLVDMVQNALWFWSRLFTTAFWIPLPLYLRQNWELFVGVLACALIALPALRRDTAQLRWSFWILAATAPFITMSSDYLDGLASGPSRYLYWSNAGFCIALSCYFYRGIKWVAADSKTSAIALAVCAAVLLLVSSANAFRVAEYSTFYTAGRNGFASMDYDRGIYWLQRAILGRENVVPLEDAYEHLGMVLLSERGQLDKILHDGLARYPESFELNVYRMVIDSMNPQQSDDRAWKQLLPYREIDDYAEIVGMAYFNMGRGLADQEDRGGATEAYRRSLFFRPDRSQVLERLGALLIVDGQSEEGLAALQRAVDLVPYNSGYRHSLALALLLAGRTEEAIVACHQGLQVKATSELYHLLGECLGRLGKKEEAIAAFRHGLQIFPNDRALLRGLAKAEKGMDDV